jgi:hypothetical protein
MRAGAVVRADMLVTIQIPKGSRVEGGFLAGEEGKIVGRKLASPIYGRQQLSEKAFDDGKEALKPGEAFFVIPAEWIAMRSSALRRGDQVEVFPTSGGALSFGTFTLAFVKDAEEREIRDVNLSGEILCEPEKLSDRTDAGAVVDHVEIVALKPAYDAIRAFAAAAEAPSLLLVRREDRQ